MSTLKIANLYYENPITIFSVPNFIGRTQDLPSTFPPSDEYFSQQWPLHNTAQDPPGGTDDADIDALVLKQAKFFRFRCGGDGGFFLAQLSRAGRVAG
jgi:hypothetical protein